MWVAGGNGSNVPSLYYSYDGINWSSNASGGFSVTVNGIAYSQTLIPDIQTSNLNFYLQGQPTYLTQTHQILTTASSLVLDNTLYVNKVTNKVGINNPNPQYTLDIGGVINASSITVNGQPITVGGINGLDLVSTVEGLGSSSYLSSYSTAVFELDMVSSIEGLGSVGYISTLSNVNMVSSIGIYTGGISSIQMHIGSLYYAYSLI
jgi:hypothetical protein